MRSGERGHGAEEFRYHVRVQFDHTDAQGRVFYARYFRLIDQARCAYWERLGFPEDAVRQIENDTVIVHVEADSWVQRHFTTCYGLLSLQRALGRSSLHLDYRVVNEQSGQAIFTARMVMVHVDLATGTSRPWSTAFRRGHYRVPRPAGGAVVKSRACSAADSRRRCGTRTVAFPLGSRL